MPKANIVTKKEDIEHILSITEDTITKDWMYNTFGEFNGVKRFDPTDEITIPKGSYGPEGSKNKNDFVTTVGRYTYNKYFIEQDLFDLFQYIQKNINGDVYEEIDAEISYAVLENRISMEVFKKYLMKPQFLMRFVAILCPNHTMKMLNISSYLNKEKERLIKENAEAIKRGDEVVSAKIEKELLALSKEYLKDDPSMDMFDSKARGKFDNNFKNIFVMRGAMRNPDPAKGFDVTTSNYIDGISKEEYAIFANSAPAGAYYRAKNTQVGGHWVKLFNSAFQHVMLAPADTDCGTSRTIDVFLTSKNIKDWMYSYVVEGSKLIEITSQNKDSYIGKTVKLRYSSLCELEDNICNKCMGNLFYRLGIYNVGMTTTKIPSRVMNLSLKAFHDSSIRVVEMDLNKVFGVNKVA